MSSDLTIIDRGPATLPEVLDAARALAPAIAERAAEIEAARRIPPDLLDQLITAGCFRVLLPNTHGGISAALPDALRLFEALARVDASTGWTVMIGASSWRDLVGLPRATFDDLFAPETGTIIAGAFNPSGSITAVDGGSRVSGRWSFASGCQHADWLFANCVAGVTNGVPELRIAVLSPDQVTIEDTWNVSGMCGTGSHHFRVDDVVVAAERTLDPLAEESCVDVPTAHISPPALFSQCIASVAVGIAQGALDDITELATAKVPLLADGPLAANTLFQHDLATADTELRAARALLYETAGGIWDLAVAATPPSLEQRARIRSAAAWVAERAAEVVRVAHRAGGGTSIYADCPLQRRLRDVEVLTQHFLVRRDTLTTAGAILAGQDVELMVF